MMRQGGHVWVREARGGRSEGRWVGVGSEEAVVVEVRVRPRHEGCGLLHHVGCVSLVPLSSS